MSDVSTIFQVWNKQGEGYVSLPRKLRGNDTPKGPKNNKGKWENDFCFKWPDDLEKIKDYIKQSSSLNYDLYWCPTVLSANRRIKENIPQSSVLYADLDEVNPSSLSDELKPSVAWESSPNRFAAIWFLDKPLKANEWEKLNKSLTYFIGADKGGWDLTQVLRIPGTKNFKYEGAPKGRLLYYNESTIDPRVIPILPDESLVAELDDTLVVDSTPSRLLSIISSVKDKIKPKTLSLLITPEEEILLYDRSQKLWELECQLIEQGISPQKVLELVACSNWNKYRGRRDEARRLQTEIDKVVSHVGKPKEAQSTNSPLKKKWISYSELLATEIDKPKWMIEGIWQEGSHGIIAGEPKTYKSVLATDMAVSVASGRPFLGKYPVRNQGPVLYIQEENSDWLVQDRIRKISNARGTLEGEVEILSNKLIRVKMPPDLPIQFLNCSGSDMTNPEDTNDLEKAIQEFKPVLVIFDPLYLMLGEKDESSSKDVRPVLVWLLKIKQQYKTSVIVLHHWNKAGKSERGGQRMLGSVLLHGWVESALYTKVVDEQKHIIEVEREFRSFEKPEKVNITFNFGEPGDLHYEALVNKNASADQVENLLGNIRRTTVEELHTQLGISTRKAKQRLDQLVKDGKATVSGDIYTIKEEE